VHKKAFHKKYAIFKKVSYQLKDSNNKIVAMFIKAEENSAIYLLSKDFKIGRKLQLI